MFATIVHWICHLVLAGFALVCKRIPNNRFLFAYTINHADGSPYMTRVLLPRFRGRRYMLHWWHSGDIDVLHNHPWDVGSTRVLMGGYSEERLDEAIPDWRLPLPCRPDRILSHLRRGDRMALTKDDFHRVTNVLPRTWTLFLAGERVQKWGFLIDDVAFVPFDEYFKAKNIRQVNGLS